MLTWSLKQSEAVTLPLNDIVFPVTLLAYSDYNKIKTMKEADNP